MLPNYSLGYISSSIEAIFNMNGHLMVSDGCCSLDIPGGASGSPIFYEKKYKESEAYFTLYKSFKLAGVAFSSRNTEATHRLAFIIASERITELLDTF